MTTRISAELEAKGQTKSEEDAVGLRQLEASPPVNSAHPTVLVITDYDDLHADAVIDALNVQHVPVFRLNTSDFAIAGQITMQVAGTTSGNQVRGEVSNALRKVSIEDVHSVWYRRPGQIRLNPAIAPNAQPYAQEQFRLALQYFQGALQAKWVNHPAANRRADNKMLQLTTARRLGFEIPDTVLTNSPHHLQSFRAEHAEQEIIVKDLDLSVASAKLLSRGIGTQALATNFVPEPSIVAAAPVVAQPFVPKAYELRCNVIGDQVFSARIDSPKSARLDWRQALGAAPDGSVRDLNQYSRFDLPSPVAKRLRDLCRAFDLRFAAIDLIVTPSDEYVFLELNPNGQWLWLQWDAHLPLIETMVHELTDW
jgi:glutathione synthase/RimK-type ligase-like ATP-grasp enzyme